MDDILATKSRHGHDSGKGFWWIKNLIVDGKKTSIMVMFGNIVIGDKACYRIGTESEVWFEAETQDREAIIEQGKELIRKQLKNKDIRNPDNTPYQWD
ncbi:MAG: hypothetical protein A2487_12160 [Candidatus Raymondbacteria bacterium RifOxyC12_full_50_8]|uniref:Uncharacterized protein n=1 Tax=Candidatus Raymondbacteria bacterium RIFOXYD12_FULL_49_13 TaxID=1817890 RepID=A0A1F7FC08_UNCRA|nr:MAG: hypothetical protein A2248_03420 [Candidatus Raymondbacteria bacterium RIFOXYA2_FULL_49_16]OGJ96601.1 MAG: hypothetical protein A2487_12160 [Candidatus Raymondbacteria bacterium RifOxyC12_full_50_8]OGJ99628.1 MAG: hypothetical protein A2350_16075 [Candidatus Raymondbacteria bacterium RifOxyB12_full_50_8]OGK04214.1 MAG: hypothetical protein A2519_17785 [Candidatus Raymondbacteria bacterium RIFOXYD12_FULL_49_13]OGP42504.1 MAG: hypothetical protein A2324_17455 [Candidatus Raymondbacteria b